MTYVPDMHSGKAINVADLIDHLQTLPQNLLVVGWTPQETAGFVSLDSIRVARSAGGSFCDLYNGDGTYFVGKYLDIMGN